MSETSRRKFMAAAGVGAAASTVGLTAGAASAAKPHARRAQEPVLVVVDHRSSELRFLVGEREVVVNDRDLATRILNAAGGK